MYSFLSYFRSPQPTHPRVGIAVFLLNRHNKFLLGKRKGSHGAGTCGLPGGHLEFNESWADCAIRETEEETNLKIKDVRYLTATNDVMLAENKHYITIFVAARIDGDPDAQPEVMEPNKCAGWEWVSWEELASDREKHLAAVERGEETTGRKLFLPLLSLFDQREGFSPFAGEKP